MSAAVAAPEEERPAPAVMAEDTADDGPLTGQDRTEALTLLASVFLVAACGLIYELLIATVSSYLLGSSVTQFSLCIGTFIGAMGLGSYVSQYASKNLLRLFLSVEVALAVVGGASAWALYGAYAYLGSGYYAVLFGTLIAIGALVGLELPLLTRLLNRYGALKTTIAQALSFDYVGSLLGSVLFPLLLLPLFGTARTAFLVGLVNVAVAAYNLHVFRPRLAARGGSGALYGLTLACGLSAAGLAAGFAVAEKASAALERRLYEDPVIFSKQTPYQKITVTRYKSDLRLYLDGNLQFSASDEYRYHEPLIHPVMALTASPESVLVLGGGDGLAVREILKHPGVRKVTLVDIDPAMTDLARKYPALVEENRGSLLDPRVTVVHKDAFTFLADSTERWGAVIADLPDPNNEALGKLYSREFFGLIRRHLSAGGVFVTQAASPLFSRDAFWCVRATVAAAGFGHVLPYHTYVPSFGDWGFVLAWEKSPLPLPLPRGGRGVPGAVPLLASPAPPAEAAKNEVGDRPPSPAAGEGQGERALSLAIQRLTDRKISLRYLGSASPASLTAFDADNGPIPVEVSTLDHPRILRYYEAGAKKWE